MNKEIQSIIRNFQNVLGGQPWYGRSIYAILQEVNPANVFKRPFDGSHSQADLLYHVLTWAEFALKRLQREEKKDLAYFENLDWREIDPVIHSWEKGVQELKTIHEQIIEILQSKDDEFLKEIVDYRKYNFRFMLNGLIQHNIYHLGQIAYINKTLS